MKKSKHDIQLEAVQSILAGELLLEEAMQKYNIKDKRTMTAWIRKMMPFLEESSSISKKGEEKLSQRPSLLSSVNNVESMSSSDYLRSENVLLKKLVHMQDKIRELEEVNGRLLMDRKFLSEKVIFLELKLQLSEKG